MEQVASGGTLAGSFPDRRAREASGGREPKISTNI